MRRLELPEQVVRMTLLANGERGQRWLEGLPAVVEELARRWRLDIGDAFPGGCVGFVAPAERPGGEQVVLKVSLVDEETRPEADALRHWGGDGAVRLLDSDPRLGALLLERLLPGTSLQDHPDRDEAIHTGCLLLRRLWRPPPSEHQFPLVTDLAARWARDIPPRFDGLGKPFESRLAVEAARWCADVAASEPRIVLANRDFHLGNVLAAGREPWLLIDPKPLAGERAFDTGHLLRSLLPDEIDGPTVRDLVQRLADEFDLEPDRIRGWALVRSVEDALWALGIGETESVDRDLACARALLAMG